MSNLQRSSSAPLTVAGLANEQQPLSRTKSHLHVEKPQRKLYPRVVAAPSPSLASSSSSSERVDPFNLAGFFPPEKESWGWLRAEAERVAEEAEDVEDSDEEAPTAFEGGSGVAVPGQRRAGRDV